MLPWVFVIRLELNPRIIWHGDKYTPSVKMSMAIMHIFCARSPVDGASHVTEATCATNDNEVRRTGKSPLFCGYRRLQLQPDKYLDKKEGFP